MQHWLEEAPAGQPYHMIAEVVFASETNHSEMEAERRKVGSQIAQAGSQGSAKQW